MLLPPSHFHLSPLCPFKLKFSTDMCAFKSIYISSHLTFLKAIDISITITMTLGLFQWKYFKNFVIVCIDSNL
jgi:hypothetical protein